MEILLTQLLRTEEEGVYQETPIWVGLHHVSYRRHIFLPVKNKDQQADTVLEQNVMEVTEFGLAGGFQIHVKENHAQILTICNKTALDMKRAMSGNPVILGTGH